METRELHFYGYHLFLYRSYELKLKVFYCCRRLTSSKSSDEVMGRRSRIRARNCLSHVGRSHSVILEGRFCLHFYEHMSKKKPYVSSMFNEKSTLNRGIKWGSYWLIPDDEIEAVTGECVELDTETSTDAMDGILNQMYF